MPKQAKRSVVFPQTLWDAMSSIADKRLMPVDSYVFAIVSAAIRADAAAFEAEEFAAAKRRGSITHSVQEDVTIPEEAERANTASGYAGVYPNGRGWKAMYKGENLGTFGTLPEAVVARTQAKNDAEALAEENRKAILDSINNLPVTPAPAPDITQVARGGPRPPPFKPRQKGPSGSMRRSMAPTASLDPLGITVITVPGWDDDEDEPS